MSLRLPFIRLGPGLLAVLAALIAGSLIGVVVPLLVGQSLYRLAIVTLGLVITLALLVTRAPRHVLLVFLVLAVPLNLTFTPFGDPPWHTGGAPSVPVIYLYDVPLAALLALWVADALANKRPARLNNVQLVTLVLILWSALSLANSIDHALTIMELVRLAKLALLAHVVSVTVRGEGRLRDVAVAFMLGLSLQGVFSLLQYAFGFDLGGLGFTVGDVRRVSGTVGYPNTLGAFAAALLCLPIARWLTGTMGSRGPLFLLVIVLGSVPLALSFSRGAWVALAAAVGVMYTVAIGGRRANVAALAMQLAVVTVLVVVGALALSEQIGDRAREDTFTVREELNAVAVRMTAAQPVVGVGLNTFVPSLRTYDPLGLYTYFREPVHNVYLLLSAETGIVGLVAFLLLVALAFRDAAIVLRRANAYVGALALGVVGGMVAILVSNISDVHLRTDVIYATWWVFIGLVMGMRRYVESARAGDKRAGADR